MTSFSHNSRSYWIRLRGYEDGDRHRGAHYCAQGYDEWIHRSCKNYNTNIIHSIRFVKRILYCAEIMTGLPASSRGLATV
jgi:hypothetical protein